MTKTHTEIRIAPMKKDPHEDNSFCWCEKSEAEFFDVYTAIIGEDGMTLFDPSKPSPKGHIDIDVSFKTEQAAAHYAYSLAEITAWDLDAHAIT